MNTILNAFTFSDCLIISSTEETGPITGIEAMAAGKLIISTKVGAMPERLKDNCYWYDGSQEELSKIIKKVVINESFNDSILDNNRLNYMKNYNLETIKNNYLQSLNTVL